MTTSVGSDLVTLASGRTLSEKLTDVISAADYGALPAGSALANTTAIGLAITAAAASGAGGFVLIGPGIAYTEGSLVIPDNVTLIVIGSVGAITFVVKDQGSAAIAKGGIGIRSQGHTGVILRAVDQGVAAQPMVQVVDGVNGDIAAIETAFMEQDAIAAPAAPAASKCRIFSRLNAGKVELCVQFPTGAIQQIKIEA